MRKIATFFVFMLSLSNFQIHVNAEIAEPQLIPISVEIPNATIATGAYSYGAVQNDGTLLLWGNPYMGIERQEDNNGIYDSTLKNITSVWLSQWAGMALDAQGQLWGFGSYIRGQLGPLATHVKSPVLIMDEVVTADIGLNFCVALKKDGTVWIWGTPIYTQPDKSLPPTQIATDAIFVRATIKEHIYIISSHYELIDLGQFQDIAVGAADHPTVLQNNVRWGDDGFAISTDNTLYQFDTAGVAQQILTDVKVAHCGSYPIITAVQQDGSLYAWNYDTEKLYENSLINGSPLKLLDKVSYAVGGPYGLIVLMENGQVYIYDYRTINELVKSLNAELLPLEVQAFTMNVMPYTMQTVTLILAGTTSSEEPLQLDKIVNSAFILLCCIIIIIITTITTITIIILKRKRGK